MMTKGKDIEETSTEQVHATCVAIDGRAVLICAPSGSGKTDLALQLIDRGAALISDDRVNLRRENDKIITEAPANISGKIEVAGLGIVEIENLISAHLALKVILRTNPDRFPMDSGIETILGLDVPVISLTAHEGSAPIKVEIALGTWPAMIKI